MKRRLILKNSIAFVFVIISICCFLVLLVSILRLPGISSQNIAATTTTFRSGNEMLGKFGNMMIDMLPEDLAFTVFVPSEKAFERDLKLRVNDSLIGDKINDTDAVISRILGFSVVPRSISSAGVEIGKEAEYDSLCGYRLWISKDVNGMMVVNGVRSEIVDVVKREIVVHVMDGVIMDADFGQSFESDEGED